MKKVLTALKKIIFSFFILYGFNMLASEFNIIIPINWITISFVSLLGFPALFSLVLLFVLIY
ncbi:MAG: hypothetical protein E7168_00360 [Firmicutes bacterium]|nr:hypothetical protein [Bacillota bacterium]